MHQNEPDFCADASFAEDIPEIDHHVAVVLHIRRDAVHLHI